MTKYELIEFYKRVLNQISELDVYTKQLMKLYEDINKQEENIMVSIYEGNLNDNEVRTKVATKKNQIINTIQQFAMSFDMLTNHEKLVRIENKLNDYFKLNEDVFLDEKEEIIAILNEFRSVTKNLYEYIRTKSNSEVINVLNQITIVVNKYDKLIASYNSVKDFMEKTEKEIHENDFEKVIELQFYSEINELKDFIAFLEDTNESYEILGRIMGISTVEYSLKIVKIESGSLFQKLFGEEKILDAISFLIKKVANLIFSKFTLEGNIIRHTQILDLLSKEVDFVEKLDQLGVNVDFEKEEIKKSHIMLMKSIHNMISKTTRIKINDEEFSLRAELQDEYLAETKNLLLSDEKKNR